MPIFKNIEWIIDLKKNHENRAKYTPLHVFPPLNKFLDKFISQWCLVKFQYGILIKNAIKKGHLCSDKNRIMQSGGD